MRFTLSRSLLETCISEADVPDMGKGSTKRYTQGFPGSVTRSSQSRVGSGVGLFAFASHLVGVRHWRNSRNKRVEIQQNNDNSF